MAKELDMHNGEAVDAKRPKYHCNVDDCGRSFESASDLIDHVVGEHSVVGGNPRPTST